MIPFHAVQLVASLQHSVEFIDEHRNRFMAVVGLYDRIHVGPVDCDVALGLELHADHRTAIAFQFHADTHDAFLVAEETFGFLVDKGLERWSQLKVNARNDHFVVVLAVHVSAFGLG